MRADDPTIANTNSPTPTCQHCGTRMRSDSYLAFAPRDVPRDRNGRAPMSCAWHCRCGM